MRCLIVDDAPAIRVANAAVMRHFWPDAQIEEAVDGASAVAAVERQRPDLVLLDMNLGDGPDGLDVLRTLRRQNPHLPVVLITALPDDDPRVVGAESLGIQALLRKPVRAERLRSAVDEALAGRSTRMTWRGSRSP